MFNFKKMRSALSKASKNGFLLGVGSILNIIPVYGSPEKTLDMHPDMHVLKSDWKNIGADFNKSIKKIVNER
jgi:hypothetical protein